MKFVEIYKTNYLAVVSAYGNNTTLVVPETYNSKTVNLVGDHGFAETSIKSVYLPKSINRIGRFSFSGCKNLFDVKLSEGLKEIDEYAFFECPSLRKIRIPESVHTIGTYAFAGNPDLVIEAPAHLALRLYDEYKHADNVKIISY